MNTSFLGRILIICLLVFSIILYYESPEVYDYSFCLMCFIVFVITTTILLANNTHQYKTMILFETLFSISFFFTNYVYPLFLYQYSPYFSLFKYNFNENIISKATALATIGFCSYAYFQYETKGNIYQKDFNKSAYSFNCALYFWLNLSVLISVL